MSQEELSDWLLDRAKIVVSGRITEVRAGVDITRAGSRVVVATLKVNSVVKGNVPTGAMSIVTGFGTGDCGLAGALLVGLAQNRDVAIEVQVVPELKGEYAVDICGYSKMSAGHAN